MLHRHNLSLWRISRLAILDWGPNNHSTVSNIADIEAFIREKEVEDGRTYMTVCDLPPSEAPQIMRELELMGITYGSLFPGLDGICRDFKDRLFTQAG